MGNAARELGDFETSLQIAEGIGNGLAVLRRDQACQLLAMGIGKLEELHHHAAAELRILGRPRGLGCFGILNGRTHFRH